MDSRGGRRTPGPERIPDDRLDDARRIRRRRRLEPRPGRPRPPPLLPPVRRRAGPDRGNGGRRRPGPAARVRRGGGRHPRPRRRRRHGGRRAPTRRRERPGRLPDRRSARTTASLYLIDQRRLPDALIEVENRSAGEVAFAIREMVVRGAPAIGQVAAIGLAMSAERVRDARPYARRATLRGGANALIKSRPTAVNLRWAVDRMMARYEAIGDLSDDGGAIAAAMRAEADAIVIGGDHRPRPAGDVRAGGAAGAVRRAAAHPHPLQHGTARLRAVRHGARRRPGGAPCRPAHPRLGRRDPPVPAGRAADGLGAGPGRRARTRSSPMSPPGT